MNLIVASRKDIVSPTMQILYFLLCSSLYNVIDILVFIFLVSLFMSYYILCQVI